MCVWSNRSRFLPTVFQRSFYAVFPSFLFLQWHLKPEVSLYIMYSKNDNDKSRRMQDVAGSVELWAASFWGNKDDALQTLVDNGYSLNIVGDISHVLKASLCSPAVKRLGTAVNGKRRSCCHSYAPIRKTECWLSQLIGGFSACYDLDGKNMSWVLSASFPFFSYMWVYACVCTWWPSILSDVFNRALAALTEGVNVSYFIRNPQEEG